MEKETVLKLVKAAVEAKEKAYAPYSNYHVGAAVLTTDGTVFTGCNVENASYGATNCAERTAIFKMVSEGYTKISAIAIAGGTAEAPAFPCGVCRQVISEFAESGDISVIVASDEENYKLFTLDEIFPFAFML